jgi:hypothetical protein
MKKALDSDHVSLEITNGILIGRYKKGLKITLPVAKEIVRVRLEFANNVPMPALVYNMGVISIDKAARDFLSSDAGVEGLTAGAIVIDSIFTSFLGNFYLKVSKPKIPSRLFTNDAEAIKWLGQFVNKTNSK